MDSVNNGTNDIKVLDKDSMYGMWCNKCDTGGVQSVRTIENSRSLYGEKIGKAYCLGCDSHSVYMVGKMVFDPAKEIPGVSSGYSMEIDQELAEQHGYKRPSDDLITRCLKV